MPLPIHENLFININKALALAETSTLLHMMQHFKIEKIERRVKSENILLGDTDFNVLGQKLKGVGMLGMKHLYKLMERIYKLGGEINAPFSMPAIGENLNDFMNLGLNTAKERLEVHREIIKIADEIGDVETAEMSREQYREIERQYLLFEEYSSLDIKEPKGPDDCEAKILHTKVYDDGYFELLTTACQAEVSAIFTYTTQRAKMKLLALREKTTTLESIQDKNKGTVIQQMLHEICLEEMKHLELISERIFKLGGDVSDLKPYPPIEIGENLDDFLRIGKIHEDYAIVLYRKIVNTANEKGDIVTKRMFEDIIEEEDKHFYSFDDFF